MGFISTSLPELITFNHSLTWRIM